MEPRADLILANRSYLDHARPPGMGDPPTAANGGLLAAVRPVIAAWDGHKGTTWVGAGRGPCDRAFVDAGGYEIMATGHGPLRHRRLFFDDDTWLHHYGAVANSFSWPLLHLVRLPLPEITGYYPCPETPTTAAWAAHRAVNAAFVEAALAEPGCETCWVHDYQLALVPAGLRARGYGGRIGFFLHTPFPGLAVARQVLDEQGMAYFAELVRGVLGADLAGFQSEADAERFAAAAVALAGARREGRALSAEGHRCVLGAYPVGIDADDIVAAAHSPAPLEAAAAMRAPRPLVVGLERSDYTKGIPERLRAIARSYASGVPFTYVGIAAPTREGVAAYEGVHRAIETAAAEAARAAAEAGALFVHVRRAIPWDGVVALQREADVVFTSSLADGMNLVPLQAVIAQSLRPARERGVIITGRDAGVASAFAGHAADGLTIVDPLDADAMDATLAAALEGRLPPVSDRLVADVRERNARAWATSFLCELGAGAC